MSDRSASGNERAAGVQAQHERSPDSAASRASGSDKTRKMLWTLLSGPLNQDTERDLLGFAGEMGVSFSDEEAVGLIRANPDVAGLDELEERGVVRQATVEEFLSGEAHRNARLLDTGTDRPGGGDA